MKKYLIPLGVIILILIGWSTASWYTGKKIESALQSAQAQKMIHQLTQYGFNATISDYHRGWFSSQYKINIDQYPLPGNQDKPTPELSLVFNQSITHAAFPLSHLSLLPSIVIDSELVSVRLPDNQDAEFNKILQAIQKTPLLKMHTIVNFGVDHFISTLNYSPIHYQDEQNNIDFLGAQIDSDIKIAAHQSAEQLFNDLLSGASGINNLFSAVNINGKIDKLDITSKNSADGKSDIQIHSDGITFHSQSSRPDDTVPMLTGTGGFSSGALQLSQFDQPVYALAGIKISTQSTLNQDKQSVNEKYDLQINELNLKNHLIGDIKLAISFDNLNIQALVNYIQLVKQAARSDESLNPQQTLQFALDATKNNPVLRIDELSLRNDLGLLKYQFTLGLNNLAPVLAQYSTNPIAIFQHGVTTLDSKLTLPINANKKMISQFYQINGLSPADSDQQAELNMTLFEQLGKSYKLLQTENGIITSDLHYADGNVTLNGEKMSLAQFFSTMITLYGAP